MKQITQNYKTGKLELAEVPMPALNKNSVLVKNEFSLLSVGTEKTMIEMAKKSLLDKALSRPDLMRQVIAKAKTDGVMEAYKASMTRLDNPVPLGYSCAGIVLEIGEGVQGINKGDRVACAGSEYASHAEVVCVPQNLCMKIPDNVDPESASFLGLGGIALEAAKIAYLEKDDKVAVIGLGLLGQIAVQILKAMGCSVFAVDISAEKVNLAIANGAGGGSILGDLNIMPAIKGFAPQGFDSVLITASSKSNQPIELAAEIARKRARIVATGLVGLNIPRRVFFEKELEVVVSKAWGPEMPDPNYQWTAKQNFEEFINYLSKGSVKIKPLITHRFPIGEALRAYDMILKSKEPYIGVLITYPPPGKGQIFPQAATIDNKTKDKRTIESDSPVIGFIGAGLFARGILIPNLRSLKHMRLRGVATTTGISAQHAAEKFGFEYFTTDYKKILNDGVINLIFILTKHSSHANFVIEALKSGKKVFVEKPLCVNEIQLNEIIATYNAERKTHDPFLMVGFNRRFSPFSTWLKDKFRFIQEPLSIHCTINAGYVPPDHWVHKPQEGGRIIGEICHFIDLVQYFTGSFPSEVYAETLASAAYKESDNVAITMKMRNGSLVSILYVASGNKTYPRERIEIFGGGAVGIIDNFRCASFVHDVKKEKIKKFFAMGLGYREEMCTLITAILKGGGQPVSMEKYISATKATFAIEKSLKEKRKVKVDLST